VPSLLVDLLLVHCIPALLTFTFGRCNRALTGPTLILPRHLAQTRWHYTAGAALPRSPPPPTGPFSPSAILPGTTCSMLHLFKGRTWGRACCAAGDAPRVARGAAEHGGARVLRAAAAEERENQVRAFRFYRFLCVQRHWVLGWNIFAGTVWTILLHYLRGSPRCLRIAPSLLPPPARCAAAPPSCVFYRPTHAATAQFCRLARPRPVRALPSAGRLQRKRYRPLPAFRYSLACPLQHTSV